MLPKFRSPYDLSSRNVGGGIRRHYYMFVVAIFMIFVVALYVNINFQVSNSNNIEGINTIKNPNEQIIKKYSSLKERKNELIKSNEYVEAIIFASTCESDYAIHSYALAETARQVGYSSQIIKLTMNCSKKNDQLINSDHHVKVFDSKYSMNVYDPLMNPKALKEFLLQDKSISSNGYIMLVKEDTLFTKLITLSLLLEQTSDVKNPSGFGQDASWYHPNKKIISKEILTKVFSFDLNSYVFQLNDWRDYAINPPYLISKDKLLILLDTWIHCYDQLLQSEHLLHLSYSLALAHHHFLQGITGSLRLENYTSPYENWDFAEDMEYNPCNSLWFHQDGMKSISYPFTISSRNISLNQWNQEIHWQFSSIKIPKDFLSCDGWLYAFPPLTLWYDAIHTKGYEGVSTILRRRHVYSICMSIHVYNHVALMYKKKNCIDGYNENMKLMGSIKKRRISSLPFYQNYSLQNDEQDEIEFKKYGDFSYKKKMIQKNNVIQEKMKKYHFVWTSTCTGYQDWQSENLLSSAQHVQQKGYFTRILSGCNANERKEIVLRGSSHSFYHIHFTPDYQHHPYPNTSDTSYTPYNKPFGIQHWLKYANPTIEEDIIIILDPDFIFLKPLYINNSNNNNNNIQYSGYRSKDIINNNIELGLGIAQNWIDYLGPLAFTKERQEENIKLCSNSSNCNISMEDAIEYYSVGPPYILLKEDLQLMIHDYANISVTMRELHPEEWMSEMYGYSMAAAKNKIKHTRLDNLAVTNVPSEYWDFLKKLTKEDNPCKDPIHPFIPKDAPIFIHGCQSYSIQLKDNGWKWIFYKQLMPEDIYTCDAWMLTPAPLNVWEEAYEDYFKTNELMYLINAWGLCTQIKIMNQALFAYKKKYCRHGFNTHKALRLIEDRPNDFLKMGSQQHLWTLKYS